MQRLPAGEECEPGAVWPWREQQRLSCENIRSMLAANEKSVASGYPKQARELWYLIQPDVAECWPECHVDLKL